MDSQIISQSNVAGFVGGNINDISAVVPSVTMVSLQFPAPGTHTYYVEEVDNTGGCSNGTFRTRIGTTRTLIVREF
jgi:hypothetical protein